MYNSILEALSQQEQFHNAEHYLQSLQPYVSHLREEFRDSVVTVDYSDFNIQAAYLLAYYPLYIEMTHRILREISQNIDPIFAHQRELQACFLGGGPAPEAVALGNLEKLTV